MIIHSTKVDYIYLNHLQQDFLENELKPLKKLQKMHQTGKYHFLIEQNVSGEIMAYACVYDGGLYAFLDYFAVNKLLRGKGVGSAFIIELSKVFKRGVLAELSDPDFANSLEDKRQCLRRIAFYERLGFYNTTIKTQVLDCHYQIYVNSSKKIDVKEVLVSIENTYQFFEFTKEMCQVRIEPLSS